MRLTSEMKWVYVKGGDNYEEDVYICVRRVEYEDGRRGGFVESLYNIEGDPTDWFPLPVADEAVVVQGGYVHVGGTVRGDSLVAGCGGVSSGGLVHDEAVVFGFVAPGAVVGGEAVVLRGISVGNGSELKGDVWDRSPIRIFGFGGYPITETYKGVFSVGCCTGTPAELQRKARDLLANGLISKEDFLMYSRMASCVEELIAEGLL